MVTNVSIFIRYLFNHHTFICLLNDSFILIEYLKVRKKLVGTISSSLFFSFNTCHCVVFFFISASSSFFSSFFLFLLLPSFIVKTKEKNHNELNDEKKCLGKYLVYKNELYFILSYEYKIFLFSSVFFFFSFFFFVFFIVFAASDITITSSLS